MIRHAFVTVTDRDFFPGTLATVNSVLEFQPDADIYVVNNAQRGLNEPQAAYLRRHSRVRLLDSSRFAGEGRHLGAWELKAYAVHDLAEDYDVMVGIDSDCLLCSNVDAQIQRAHAIGGFLGGQDGDGVDYDDAYRVYGIATPARNPRYMSTSLYFCAVTPANRRILRRWTECCAAAVFNGAGAHPGHGDQGVLNAVLFAEEAIGRVELLENRLWSQHWVYWDSMIDVRDGVFVNRSAEGRPQRSFHCAGSEKFWTRDHGDRVRDMHTQQTYPYVWFLTMLWFGACRDWSVDPLETLPPASRHLVNDLALYLPWIFQIYPPARAIWGDLSETMIDRILSGVPRTSSSGDRLSEVAEMLATCPSARRFVEVGGDDGWSILALGLRFANRDLDLFAVESFFREANGAVEGRRAPPRRACADVLARLPHLRVRLLPGDSAMAARAFDDGGVDVVFIGGSHEPQVVLRDIQSWRPKLSRRGIIAGDDNGVAAVRQAVAASVPDAHTTPSGKVWCVRLGG